MKKSIFAILILCFSVSNPIFGWSDNRTGFEYGSAVLLPMNSAVPFFPIPFSKYSTQFYLQNNYFPIANYELGTPCLNSFELLFQEPSLPFFCNMEYHIQQHTNVWIKFRAGTDADYMRMITNPNRYRQQ